MRSLKKERLSMMVTDAIKNIIKTEAFKNGDKFYSENQLSTRMEVSRSSIREAIRMLEVTGWVKVYQGKGVFISEPMTEDVPVKQWAVDNTDLLREHFEVRLLVEPHAAAEAARRSDDRDLEAMQAVYDDFCQHVKQDDVAGAIVADSQFHQLIAKATRNRTLSIIMKTMGETLNEGWYASLNIPGRLERTIGEHGAVLEAIKHHDAEAAGTLMRTHLVNALADIKKHVGSWETKPGI